VQAEKVGVGGALSYGFVDSAVTFGFGDFFEEF
jgi:hypothetical protein